MLRTIPTLEIMVIIKWTVLAFVGLMVYKVISVWATDVASRILYGGLFNRRKDNKAVTQKNGDGKSWMDRFLDAQVEHTEAMNRLTVEMTEIKIMLKQLVIDLAKCQREAYVDRDKKNISVG